MNALLSHLPAHKALQVFYEVEYLSLSADCTGLSHQFPSLDLILIESNLAMNVIVN